METKSFTLLDNFLPIGTYEGLTGNDSHGKFILFPKELRNIITAGCFLKTENNETLQIYEERHEVIDNIPMLKVYYS